MSEQEYYQHNYFSIDIDAALSLAARQMNTVHEELDTWDGHLYQGFLRHQLLHMSEVISFLGALVAAQRREIEQLQRRVTILEDKQKPEEAFPFG